MMAKARDLDAVTVAKLENSFPVLRIKRTAVHFDLDLAKEALRSSRCKHRKVRCWTSQKVVQLAAPHFNFDRRGLTSGRHYRPKLAVIKTWKEKIWTKAS
jgi:hypothetical protein